MICAACGNAISDRTRTQVIDLDDRITEYHFRCWQTRERLARHPPNPDPDERPTPPLRTMTQTTYLEGAP